MTAQIKTAVYKGVRLPVEVIQKIKSAGQQWRKADRERWIFAEQADEIVGLYIPDATQLLAIEMGVESPSTPEGYARANQLRAELLKIKHDAPLSNLFISHYIVAGKAFFAKDSQWSIKQIDKLLREANEWNKSVEWLRGKLGKVQREDSWQNSARIEIQNITRHIINAPYLGTDEFKASIAARVGSIFVQVLKWAIGETEKNPLEQELNSPNWDRAADAIMAVIHRMEDETN